MSEREPVFFYDLYSPYAYLAALRVDDVLPVAPRWRPIFFGVVLREVGKIPWSLRDGDREAGQAEVARRARERGVPEVRWPNGWPRDSYAGDALRAIVFAGQRDAAAGKALSLALYRLVFEQGRRLDDEGIVGDASAACGFDGEELLAGGASEAARAALRANTADALDRGVTGIPTVAVGDALYWGDDRLEDAAAAVADKR
jgi:2-hydroxychromene-2-carboxylate isomerase